jgi:hypothetical protein
VVSKPSLSKLDAPGDGASDRVIERAGFNFEGTQRQKADLRADISIFSMLGVTDVPLNCP